MLPLCTAFTGCCPWLEFVGHQIQLDSFIVALNTSCNRLLEEKLAENYMGLSLQGKRLHVSNRGEDHRKGQDENYNARLRESTFLLDTQEERLQVGSNE